MRRSTELLIGFLCGVVLLFAGIFGKELQAVALGAFVAGMFLGKLDGVA